MKLKRFAALLSFVASAVSAQVIPPLPAPLDLERFHMPQAKPAPAAGAGASFDFSRVPLNAFVQLVLSDGTDAAYVIDPDLMQDGREISVRAKGKGTGELRQLLATLLKPLGYSVQLLDGITRVSKTPEAPAAAPVELERQVVVYRPRHRSAQYLADLVQPLFGAQAQVISNKHQVANPAGLAVDPPPGSAAALLDRQTDVLVMQLTEKQRGIFDRAVAQLDVPVPEVMVQATLYEVTVTNQDASALSVAAKLFGGRTEINLGAGQLDNNVRINLPGLSLDALVSALQSDSRFKVVSNPRLRVRDGSSARLVVGSDVPVLGAVSYPGNGATPVRSVEYKTSGVVFDLKPHIRGEVVDLQLQQQLSSFSKTTTGVNDSPTLIRRDLSSSITARPGELIVLGGLVDSKADGGASGLSWLPSWTHSRSSSDTRTELLLVLSVGTI